MIEVTEQPARPALTVRSRWSLGQSSACLFSCTQCPCDLPALYPCRSCTTPAAKNRINTVLRNGSVMLTSIQTTGMTQAAISKITRPFSARRSRRLGENQNCTPAGQRTNSHAREHREREREREREAHTHPPTHYTHTHTHIHTHAHSGLDNATL